MGVGRRAHSKPDDRTGRLHRAASDRTDSPRRSMKRSVQLGVAAACGRIMVSPVPADSPPTARQVRCPKRRRCSSRLSVIRIAADDGSHHHA